MTAGIDASTEPAPLRETAVSLAFWVSLLMSAGLYAAATLAPKVTALESREQELRAQAARVETRVAEVDRLLREAHALETDGDYLAAVARRRLGVRNSDELVLESSSGAAPAAAERLPTLPAPTRFASALAMLSRDGLLRSRLLVASAALILFAFTFLHARSRSVPPRTA